ncbi:MAG TPA: NAD(P)-dependent oxidoreductase, partial [Ramlibacter sp.]|nr:NAD(P)-dependent oxidoreductase [Ramlibacter sp.]
MKPRILVARAIFPETLDKMRAHFDVEDNQADELWDKQQFAARLADKHGALTTAQPVDAETLANAAQLKICANMAVGYNNFDVAAMTARGVLGTNTPDVLTETTADFGFALVMAVARRMTESEIFLRAGQWDRWRYDMFVGSEVHGSTLGILGMGRIGQGIARRGAHGFGMNVI